MAPSLWKRKRDLTYLVFFLIHVPIIFIVDLSPLYPASIKPAFITAFNKYYIDTYRDQFFISPPAWFNAYIWMELIYHLPLSIWAISALWRDDPDPKLPLHLLVFAVQTGLTTLTCIADYLSWKTVTNDEKIRLSYLYFPYLALAVFMAVDMFSRLEKALSRAGGRSVADGRGKKIA